MADNADKLLELQAENSDLKAQVKQLEKEVKGLHDEAKAMSEAHDKALDEIKNENDKILDLCVAHENGLKNKLGKEVHDFAFECIKAKLDLQGAKERLLELYGKANGTESHENYDENSIEGLRAKLNATKDPQERGQLVRAIQKLRNKEDN
jgi:cell division septum initiation protein DivIVA